MMRSFRTRLFPLLGLAVLLALASCSKEEPMAPGSDPHGVLKNGGDGMNGDLPRLDLNDDADQFDADKETDPSPVGLYRDFEGEGGPDDNGGISDDGDDEGDKEKSNKKPRVN
jgi:hypothetical protein